MELAPVVPRRAPWADWAGAVGGAAGDGVDFAVTVVPAVVRNGGNVTLGAGGAGFRQRARKTMDGGVGRLAALVTTGRGRAGGGGNGLEA